MVHETDRAGSVITSSRATPGTNSAHLIAYGGNTGAEWNAFVYGTAETTVSRVVLRGFDRPAGGMVVDGVWVIALREKDVSPDQLHWSLLAADGSVIESGTGIFPPDA